jgi:hypothetical protein
VRHFIRSSKGKGLSQLKPTNTPNEVGTVGPTTKQEGMSGSGGRRERAPVHDEQERPPASPRHRPRQARLPDEDQKRGPPQSSKQLSPKLAAVKKSNVRRRFESTVIEQKLSRLDQKLAEIQKNPPRRHKQRETGRPKKSSIHPESEFPSPDQETSKGDRVTPRREIEVWSDRIKGRHSKSQGKTVRPSSHWLPAIFESLEPHEFASIGFVGKHDSRVDDLTNSTVAIADDGSVQDSSAFSSDTTERNDFSISSLRGDLVTNSKIPKGQRHDRSSPMFVEYSECFHRSVSSVDPLASFLPRIVGTHGVETPSLPSDNDSDTFFSATRQAKVLDGTGSSIDSKGLLEGLATRMLENGVTSSPRQKLSRIVMEHASPQRSTRQRPLCHLVGHMDMPLTSGIYANSEQPDPSIDRQPRKAQRSMDSNSRAKGQKSGADSRTTGAGFSVECKQSPCSVPSMTCSSATESSPSSAFTNSIETPCSLLNGCPSTELIQFDLAGKGGFQVSGIDLGDNEMDLAGEDGFQVTGIDFGNNKMSNKELKKSESSDARNIHAAHAEARPRNARRQTGKKLDAFLSDFRSMKIPEKRSLRQNSSHY